MTELYIVFNVADSEYALPVTVVRQLETYQGATRVPGAAPHVAGIVQIRGQVIPVIDLRRLFGYPSVEPTLDTRVVVTEYGERLVALVVDKGREVLRIDPSGVQTTPTLVEQGSRGMFSGLVQLGARVVMLLDLRKVVGEEDLNVESPKQLEPGLHDPSRLPERANPSGDGGHERSGQER
jgi:purine-binding chemotaxis protein CheW